MSDLHVQCPIRGWCKGRKKGQYWPHAHQDAIIIGSDGSYGPEWSEDRTPMLHAYWWGPEDAKDVLEHESIHCALWSRIGRKVSKQYDALVKEGLGLMMGRLSL